MNRELTVKLFLALVAVVTVLWLFRLLSRRNQLQQLKATLEKREQGLFHVPNSQIPYTGWTKKLHPNGKVALLGALKDGKPDGLWTWWDGDGQKEQQSRFKNGVKVK